MKRSLRPTSVLQLVLIAFALVGVPLAAALVTATLGVDRLASQSRQSVRDAAQVIDAGRALVEEVTAMERNARQYQLLGDPQLLEGYLRRRQNYLQAVGALSRREFSDEYQRALSALVEEEQAVFAVLSVQASGSAEAGEAVEQFAALGELARRVLAGSSREIGQAVDAMRHAALDTQRQLFWQALTVIPAALVMAAIGTMLVTRPVRRIDRAIRQLGRGEFDKPVEVSGPRDLEELGDRLEWLRLRLRDLDAQKIRFLRHVSHELKTPLSTIREGTQLLADQVAGPLTPGQIEIANILVNSSIQLQKRIEDLLNFNTVVQGLGRSVNYEPVKVGSLLDQVLSDQRVSIAAKSLRLERGGTDLVVAADREQLRIILDNLLSNAIKYSPPGGRLGIRLTQHQGHAVIEVQDEGPGISREDRPKVFEPFYQGSAVHDGHVKGTGLGLAIAQEYVRAHRGSIEVAEARRGACLRVRLPLDVVPAESPIPALERSA